MLCHLGNWGLKQLNSVEKDDPRLVKEIAVVSYFQRWNQLNAVSHVLSLLLLALQVNDIVMETEAHV